MLNFVSINVMEGVLDQESVKSTHSTSHDDSWQEEASGDPYSIGSDGENVPATDEYEKVNRLSMVVSLSIIMEKGSNGSSLGIEKECGQWVVSSLFTDP